MSSGYLFNNDVVKEYLEKVTEVRPSKLPEIVIEVYLAGEIPQFLGDNNSLKEKKKPGIKLTIHFDEDYEKEYVNLKKEELVSLPLEYYTVTWESFAREIITSRSIPLKSSYINSTSNRNGSDWYISSIVKNMLSEQELINISQIYRKFKDSFAKESNISSINQRLHSDIGDDFTLTVDYGTKDSWRDNIATQLDGVIYENIGHGDQCRMKTKLSLNEVKDDTGRVLLFEEPECHLSHSHLNKIINEIDLARETKQVIVTTHSSFVANKLGLKSLILLKRNVCITFSHLEKETINFFKKISGYDTLRMILSKKIVLVEGDSDELIVQKGYKDRYGKLPIEDCIDIISVGTSFKRFLEIAERLNLKTFVITDNDGDLEAIKKKYSNYLEKNKKDNITISFDQNVYEYNGGIKDYNNNTLEPCLLRTNSLKKLNEILNKSFKTEDELCKYMKENKTQVALSIFESNISIEYPEYIDNVIDKLGD